MILRNFEELEKIRKENPAKKIVLCTGAFDITHVGHILFFENCKKFGDILVAILGSDALCKINKGDTRPILREEVRLKTVDSIKSVDYVLLDTITKEKKGHTALEEAFKRLQPNAYVVNDDGFDLSGRSELAKKYGVAMKILQRQENTGFEDISTTAIIEKIKQS